ncbi:MAG: riboflavin kinase [Actinobacteria bacterium]|uniref:riboflavin kinase n=1 Tax=freshwater metagenome TaxID=449393 RepID=A0A6J7MBG2_9ZZZZ|nr:riboflavin kinase [Actinomycetota bacterium]
MNASEHDALIHLPVVDGAVVMGDQRGRLLGFPTANLELGDMHGHITDGVYAGQVRMESGVTCPGAVSIGSRPTFYAGKAVRLLEAHLLDFAGDLYGQIIIVSLKSRLRDQIRFSSPADLVIQLGRDIESAREALRAQA